MLHHRSAILSNLKFCFSFKIHIAVVMVITLISKNFVMNPWNHLYDTVGYGPNSHQTVQILAKLKKHSVGGVQSHLKFQEI